MKRLINPVLALAFTFFAAGLHAQSSVDNELSTPDDTLVAHYLSDTRNASAKIRELDQLARDCNGNLDDNARATRLFQIALSLEPYARDSTETLSLLYAHFSTLLAASGAPKLSTQYEKAAFRLYKQVHQKPDAASYNMLGAIATYYLNNSAPDSAGLYYRLALEEARALRVNYWLAAAYNNTGILMYRSGRPAAARLYYDSALALLPRLQTHGDSDVRASVNDNLAELAAKEGQYDSALLYYRGNIALAGSHDPGRALKTHTGMLSLLTGKGEVRNIDEELEIIRGIFYADKAQQIVSAADSLRMFELFADAYSAKGDARQTIDNLNSYRKLAGELAARDKAALNRVIEALTYSRLSLYHSGISLYERTLQQERNVNRLQQAIIILLVISAVLIIAFLRIFYRNRQREHRRLLEVQQLGLKLAEAETHAARLEQAQTSRELAFQKKDVADLSLYLGRLKALYESILEKLEDARQRKPEEQQDALRRLANEVNSQLQSQEIISTIQQNVGFVNKEFNDKILQQYPNLTRSEIELCGLIRLNMTNKEVAALKNISQDSAKVMRYRLRKKLGLKEDEDIYKVISSL